MAQNIFDNINTIIFHGETHDDASVHNNKYEFIKSPGCGIRLLVDIAPMVFIEKFLKLLLVYIFTLYGQNGNLRTGGLHGSKWNHRHGECDFPDSFCSPFFVFIVGWMYPFKEMNCVSYKAFV